MHASTRPLRTLALAATAAVLTAVLVPAGSSQAATVAVAAINFQPASSPTPSGYRADTGAAYDAARGYGWVRQDSLAAATHSPLDLTRNSRDRARTGVDPLLNTLVHMQYGDSPAPSNGSTVPGAWEYAVPAGTYQVTVSAGDQQPYNSVNTVRVEGTVAVNAFTSTAAREFTTGTATVQVSDGRLTVDAVGGRNTKVNYVRIDRVTQDPAPGGTLTATSRLVFSAVKGSTSATQPVVLRNTGTTSVTIPAGGISLSSGAPFTLSGLPALPYTLAAGASVSLAAAFAAPATAGPVGATLSVRSSAPTATVVLRGLSTDGVGGSVEPSLQWVLDTWQIPVTVGDPDPSTSSLPTTNPLGPDEISAQTLVRAVSTSPVTITPIGAYGAQRPDPSIRFGWYPAGSTAGRTELATVSSAGAQSLAPAAVQSFSPGSAAFGLYTQWPPFNNRLVYTEDRFNTFDTAAPHHVRVYPMRNPDGTAVANTVVVATEETTTGQDFQDFVAIVGNVRPATTGTAGAGVATVSNLDGVPAPNRLVFSRITRLADAQQLTHDTATARITNTGTGPLRITALTVTGPFALVATPALPATVTPGGTFDIAVRFTASGTRFNTGSLSVRTDSTSTPTVPVQLAGFWQSRSEGGQEPTLRDLVALFGWTTDVPEVLDQNGAVVAQGDEVLSPYWRRVDATRPVTVRQLQAYHSYPNGATVKWFPQGGSAVNLTNINGRFAQSILPLNASNQPAAASFTPTGSGVFGFAVDGEYSDEARNNKAPDTKNGCTGACGHHVLFFPVKDAAGNAVPGTYYMTMDYSGINYDYQDNGYLITNIRPA